MAETIHPLDTAEIELKQAARLFVQTDGASHWSNGPLAEAKDGAWLHLKAAARTYGETWAKYVAPAPEDD
jgi:hypothetical protein